MVGRDRRRVAQERPACGLQDNTGRDACATFRRKPGGSVLILVMFIVVLLSPAHLGV